MNNDIVKQPCSNCPPIWRDGEKVHQETFHKCKYVIQQAPSLLPIQLMKFNCYVQKLVNPIRIGNMDRIPLQLNDNTPPDYAYYFLSSAIRQQGDIARGHYTMMYRENINLPWHYMDDELLSVSENIVDFISQSYFLILTKL